MFQLLRQEKHNASTPRTFTGKQVSDSQNTILTMKGCIVYIYALHYVHD